MEQIQSQPLPFRERIHDPEKYHKADHTQPKKGGKGHKANQAWDSQKTSEAHINWRTVKNPPLLMNSEDTGWRNSLPAKGSRSAVVFPACLGTSSSEMKGTAWASAIRQAAATLGGGPTRWTRGGRIAVGRSKSVTEDNYMIFEAVEPRRIWAPTEILWTNIRSRSCDCLVWSGLVLAFSLQFVAAAVDFKYSNSY